MSVAELGASEPEHCHLENESVEVILFYRYVPLIADEALVERFRSWLEELRLLGRLLIAQEGFNGTLAGCRKSLLSFRQEMEREYGKIDWKCSAAADAPFPGLSVRIVGEIISTGDHTVRKLIADQVSFDSSSFGGLSGTGIHLDPLDFHSHLLSRDKQNSLVLDIRNGFESAVGTFNDATHVNTVTYSQTWKKLDEILADPARLADKETTPIYLYCTGGIRCEKASAYLLSRGAKKVYQLAGGIHRYLETMVGPIESEFVGKNFVFDARGSGMDMGGGGVGEGQGLADGDGEGDRDRDRDNGERERRSRRRGPAQVGRCLQCQQPHDKYSGLICCTVCHQPTLVCPSCVSINPHPGEYHCSHHLWLKHCYFAILDGFTDSELEAQLQALTCLWDDLLLLKAKGRNRRRTVERQRQRVELELKTRSGGDKDKDKDKVEQPIDHKNHKSRSSRWGFWRD